MGVPNTREFKDESLAFARTVQAWLRALAATIDEVIEKADGAPAAHGDAVLRELRLRWLSATRDSDGTLDEDTARGNRADHDPDPRRALAYGHAMGFRSNDVLLLVAPEWYGDKYLKLSSASGPIRLGALADFMLLRTLAMHAIECPGQFIRMTDLLDRLADECKGLTTRLGDPLTDGLSETVIWRSLHRLRDKIRKAGGREEIIETSPTFNGGFRLSTPPWNIVLIDPVAATDGFEERMWKGTLEKLLG